MHLSLHDLLERKHEGGSAQRDVAVGVNLPDVAECVGHLPVQLPVDFVLLPFEVLEVLDPLKEGDCHAATVGVNVWQHCDAAVSENEVGLRCRRAVGGLHNNAALQLVRVALCDDAAHRRRHQHVARHRQQLLPVDPLRVRELCQAVSSRNKSSQLWDVQPRRVVDAATGVAYCSDLTTHLRVDLGRPGAHIAKALDHVCHVGDLPHVQRTQQLARREDGAAPGGSLPSQGAVQIDRLARHHAWVEAFVFRVLVKKPRHLSRSGVHVGRRDVLIRADDFLDGHHQLARELFHLALAHALWVDRDAALGAAKRDVHDGSLPGHEGRQAAHVVDVNLWVEAQPAFERPAAVVMLHPERVEDLDLAVVQLHHQLDADFALRHDQEALQLGRVVQLLQGLADELVRVLRMRRSHPPPLLVLMLWLPFVQVF
mmetsp:Transcript_3025/g.8244  ORF Transcript_3025/g.8244 Transcript_3025/m.8244 type:complete len:427 (+) Transcript_3025:791-2071(+)